MEINDLNNLSKTFSSIPKFNINPNLLNSLIDPKSTVGYKMDRQNELIQEQIEALLHNNKQMEDQNGLLLQNYNQLKDLFDIQKNEFGSAKKELKKSKRFNRIMLIIAIIAMLGALASPIVTWIITL